MGNFLQATVQGDAIAIERLQQLLKQDGWKGAGGVIDGALAVALELRLGANPSLFDVRKLAARVAWKYRKAKHKPSDIELVIRSALGEEISTERLSGAAIEAIKVFVFAAAVGDPDIGEFELGRLLVEAEGHARQEGYEPTLMPKPFPG